MTTPATDLLEAAYRSLDPQEALAPGSAAYATRPVAPLATLATQLRLGNGSGIHLVSGHIGSGKTTELRRLSSALESGTQATFVALDSNSPDGSMSSIEIAATLWEALGFGSRFTALARPDRAYRERETEQKIVNDIAFGLALNELHLPKPIVLLDGLDKLSLSELEPTLARMLSWNLPLTLVATVPLSYLFTPSFSRREGIYAGVHVVPALPVVTRDLHANVPAYAWFEHLLANRSVRELFDDAAIHKLAMMTAGIIRDFVRSCREAVLAALVQGRPRVDLEMAHVALAEFALRMTRPVSGDDLRVLKVVSDTGRVVGHSTFLALIDGGQIVEYRNGSNWYAVHPLLQDIVARFAQELAS